MDDIIINGGKSLSGSVATSGAKKRCFAPVICVFADTR